MKRKSALCVISTLAVLLLAGSQARADLIPWSYDWSLSSASVQSDTQASKITFTNYSSPSMAGSSDVTAANLSIYSAAPANVKDHFTDRPYSLVMVITDQATGIKGAVTFTGLLSGWVSSQGSSITNTWDGPVSETVHLGHHLYTVTADPFAPPTLTGMGGFTFDVKVQNNPEPSSLVLAGLGLSAFGAAGWRRVRRRRLA